MQTTIKAGESMGATGKSLDLCAMQEWQKRNSERGVDYVEQGCSADKQWPLPVPLAEAQNVMA